MASNHTQSSQVVAQEKSSNYMALFKELGQEVRECKYESRSTRYMSRAGELTLVDQKKLEEKKAAYGASLAELKKLDGFEAWLEEVRKKKAAKRDFMLSMMNREKNVYMYM